MTGVTIQRLTIRLSQHYSFDAKAHSSISRATALVLCCDLPVNSTTVSVGVWVTLILHQLKLVYCPPMLLFG